MPKYLFPNQATKYLIADFPKHSASLNFQDSKHRLFPTAGLVTALGQDGKESLILLQVEGYGIYILKKKKAKHHCTIH